LRRSSRREPAPGGSRSFPASPWHRASSPHARSAVSVGAYKHHEEAGTFRFPWSHGASILVGIISGEAACITSQSTRTHNSRRRLRRRCWWSGHFYVMSHPGVFEIGRILPSVVPCTAWCAAAVIRSSSSRVAWRAVPSSRRNRVGRRSTETTPLTRSALLRAVATRKREATVSGALRQASAVPAHACGSVANFGVCELAGCLAQRRVAAASSHCQGRGDAT
jgi:hypothetical protein